jgi:hypothetical protein
MSTMKRTVLAVFILLLIAVFAGCASEEQQAEKVVYNTLGTVLTLRDRPLSTKIVKISYEHTGVNKPGEKKAYYIKGFVTVRRVALKDFKFRGQTVLKGTSQDYQYSYEAKVVQGTKNTLVLVPSGLTIKQQTG